MVKVAVKYAAKQAVQQVAKKAVRHSTKKVMQKAAQKATTMPKHSGQARKVTGYSSHALGRLAGTRGGPQMSPQAIRHIVKHGNNLII